MSLSIFNKREAEDSCLRLTGASCSVGEWPDHKSAGFLVKRQGGALSVSLI